MPKLPRTGLDPTGLRSRLLESLWLWYPELPRSASLVCLGQEEFRWSEHAVFRIVTEANEVETELLVKRARLRDSGGRVQGGARPAEGALELEYRALCKLHQHLGGGHLEGMTSVRPLAYFADLESLVMECVPGQDFLTLILAAVTPWAGRTVLSGALDAVYKGGRLLATVHQIPDGPYPRRQPFDAERFQERLREKLNTLLELAPARALRESLLGVQEAAANVASGPFGETTVGFLHGDLYPDNLILLPTGRVYTIDTPLQQAGPVEEDIAKFLVGVDTLKRWLLLGRAGVKPVAVCAIQRVFLDGYRSKSSFSSGVLLLSRLLALLQRWAEVVKVMQQRVPVAIASAIQRFRINPVMNAGLVRLGGELRRECGLR